MLILLDVIVLDVVCFISSLVFECFFFGRVLKGGFEWFFEGSLVKVCNVGVLDFVFSWGWSLFIFLDIVGFELWKDFVFFGLVGGLL